MISKSLSAKIDIFLCYPILLINIDIRNHSKLHKYSIILLNYKDKYLNRINLKVFCILKLHLLDLSTLNDYDRGRYHNVRSL